MPSVTWKFDVTLFETPYTRQLVQAVESGGLVAFGERWIIENCVLEYSIVPPSVGTAWPIWTNSDAPSPMKCVH